MAGDQFRDLEGETKTGGPNVALRSPECLKEGVTFPIKAGFAWNDHSFLLC